MGVQSSLQTVMEGRYPPLTHDRTRRSCFGKLYSSPRKKKKQSQVESYLSSGSSNFHSTHIDGAIQA